MFGRIRKNPKIILIDHQNIKKKVGDINRREKMFPNGPQREWEMVDTMQSVKAKSMVGCEYSNTIPYGENF